MAGPHGNPHWCNPRGPGRSGTAPEIASRHPHVVEKVLLRIAGAWAEMFGRKPVQALLGRAEPPYTQWQWKRLDKRVGGPMFVRLPRKRLYLGTRLYDGGSRTSLCRVDFDAGRLEEVLRLPSGGDSSYPGIVLHDGVLWIAYYSSHEGNTNIYLAKVSIEPIQPDGAVPAAIQSLDIESRKNYLHVVALNVRAHLNSQIPP